MPDGVLIRPARPEDWPAIAALLSACALPTDGAQSHLADFVVVEDENSLLGTAGVEVYGNVGLMRSVAVSPRSRGHGVGNRLVAAVQTLAHARGVQQLCLLTTTAASYFEARGFARQDRAAAPAALLASAEFRGACPASAVFMSLSITWGATHAHAKRLSGGR